MAHPITPAQTAQTQSVAQQSVAKKDSDGSKGTSAFGPAVLLNLTNTKNDAAQGDPDGDGH